jgi:hypothetical protein
MAIPPASSIVRPYAGTSTRTMDKIQNYSEIMNDLLTNKFPYLADAPDALYIMMATMGHESGFKIYHRGGTTPNHIQISKFRSGIGKSYWNDPVIIPIRDDPTYAVNVEEGLSAKALMATMGMYQVRNCQESLAMISGRYRDIAESYNLMVNPGQSISGVFSNDDTGATRSMVMGCIVMETKYLRRRRNHDPSSALFFAVGDYLGKAGAKDVLGSSPEMRIALVNDSSNNIAKTLHAAGIVRGNMGRVAANPSTARKTQSETKTVVAANTNLAPAKGLGCG